MVVSGDGDGLVALVEVVRVANIYRWDVVCFLENSIIALFVRCDITPESDAKHLSRRNWPAGRLYGILCQGDCIISSLSPSPIHNVVYPHNSRAFRRDMQSQ